MHTTVEHTLDSPTAALVDDWLTTTETAERLGVNHSRVKQLLRDHKLLGAQREEGFRIPAAFVQQGQVVKGLPGTLTLLADAGYNDIEALRWLFTPDDTLPGTPAQALLENRGTEIRRRAQALAF
ncbi:DNA-binding protein [Actinomadura craniellae]|uniref:DNA-binding protein n=1 Tax=Actinomadura craniellae TaxID=2231787 RepID=A0A365H2N7_9ACTN|nr:Rv2175c family DNA-binding protein [Actinomadura craniellae]RAY13252.1 DNA-binding protein [Actinomadura craniellae]